MESKQLRAVKYKFTSVNMQINTVQAKVQQNYQIEYKTTKINKIQQKWKAVIKMQLYNYAMSYNKQYQLKNIMYKNTTKP